MTATLQPGKSSAMRAKALSRTSNPFCSASRPTASTICSLLLVITGKLRSALQGFGGTLRGYLSSEAVLVAAESRTSSPVRVPRDRESLESPTLAGLYPCGEGAGYAGGIVSAAMDGIRIARAIARAFAN